MMNDLDNVINEFGNQRNYGIVAFLKTIRNGAPLPETQLELLTTLAEYEEHHRSRRKRQRLMTTARLRYPGAYMYDIDYGNNRNITPAQMEWFRLCKWVTSFENVLITGPTGSGKSYLACALANQAIYNGYSALYRRLPRLYEELALAHGDGSLAKLRITLRNRRILVLDEWGVNQLTPQCKLDLLEIVEDRSGLGSMIITSQLPVDQWHAYIDDPTIADAIMDRVVHRSHIINLSGDSMRKLKETVQETPYV